jgi:hypothetical protein
MAASRNKSVLKERIERLFFDNHYFIILWLIIVFLGSLITITDGINILIDKYNNTLGYKHLQYTKLASLKPNIDINNYIDEFGKPTRITTNKELKTKTYVFNNKYYYLDAITDNDGTVFVYGVTTKSDDFRPRFTIPDRGKVITLNQSTLFDIYPEKIELELGSPKSDDLFLNNVGDHCASFMGVRRFGYFETHYLANPGNYQSIIIGVNDAGYIRNPKEMLHAIFPDGMDKEKKCTTITADDRRHVIINSYRVTSPFFSTEFFATKSADIIFGVDQDEFRVINDF